MMPYHTGEMKTKKKAKKKKTNGMKKGRKK